MQRRLRAVGLRPRNALVDITNYVSLDRARPLHVYDAAKLDGVVRARMGRDGETLLALDGRIYDITPAMCVIADDTRVLGLGGVMGGEHSGCSEETVDVLVESAWFDPLRTFQAGRATGINSDAKYRFERGVDPGFVVGGVELATRLILDCCGGEPSEIMVAGEPPAQNTVVSFDPDRVRQLAGLAVTPTRVRAILKTLGFETEPEASGAKRLRVTAPSWRRDIEGPADLVEEIARIEGFENVSMNAPPRAEGHRAPRASVGESRLRVARRALAGAGYLEAVTWSFTPHRHAALFGGGGASVLIANPIAADLDCMRPTPLPNLIVAAQKNLDRGYGDARLFEAGPAFGGDRDEDQSRVVAAIWQPRPQRHWRAVPAPDLFDLKRDCLMTLEALGAPVQALLTGAEAPPWWRPGRAGVLKIGPRAIAAYGEIHPRVLTALGASGPMLAFEIQVDALAPPRTRATRAKPALELNDLMPLTRDFAFVMDEATPAADLVRAAFGADKQLIADVALFDVYRGEGVGAGKKSLAVEVTLQPREQTLTEAEIEAVSQRIASAVAKATGATLRT
jgi:phenylalanyl-tRNA synthetase beta chain